MVRKCDLRQIQISPAKIGCFWNFAFFVRQIQWKEIKTRASINNFILTTFILNRLFHIQIKSHFPCENGVKKNLFPGFIHTKLRNDGINKRAWEEKKGKSSFSYVTQKICIATTNSHMNSIKLRLGLALYVHMKRSARRVVGVETVSRSVVQCLWTDQVR